MRFNPVIWHVQPEPPGLPIEEMVRRYGLTEIVKLASNEFPQPPFVEVQRAIAEASPGLNRYPLSDAHDLRAALADHYERTVDGVAVGNGSLELIMLIADTMLLPGDEVVVAEPSYMMYPQVCERQGARLVKVPVRADFQHDLEAMAAAVTARTKFVIVCNPNNPTGTYLPAAEIAAFVAEVPEDVLVVLDEAYNEFVTTPDAQDTLALVAERPNVCILRTFSKIYGLAGLRIGYALCPPVLREALDRVRQLFNVSRLAQAAALEALKHQDQVLQRSRENAELRGYLRDALEAAGLHAVPTQANFMLVGTDGFAVPAAQVCGELLRRGVILRDGHALGCPGHARVTVGTREELDFFLERLLSLERAEG
jgi:histidinol-phosphate aminotransferase